ncbi:MAG: hypothetical protein WC505_04255 [Patescibacteria group bacterium]
MSHRKKIIILLAIAISVSCAATLPPRTANAYEYERYDSGFQILPDCALDEGNCNADDFIQMFVNVASVGLKVLPYITMIMMIWAGFNLIMAGGNPTKIQEGKKMVGSIVLGIIIILFMAWAWSYFVVFVLTGSPNVFPEYDVWQKEWWGGGEGEIVTPIEGCCTLTNLGCAYVNETVCAEYEARSGIDAAFHEARSCDIYAAACDQYANTNTCCVPKDGSNGCFPVTSSTGCLGSPATHLWSANTCQNIAQCNSTP